MPVGHRHILSRAGHNCHQRADRALAWQNQGLNTLIAKEVLSPIYTKSGKLFLRPMAGQAVFLKNRIDLVLEEKLGLIITRLNR